MSGLEASLDTTGIHALEIFIVVVAGRRRRMLGRGLRIIQRHDEQFEALQDSSKETGDRPWL